MYIYIYIWYIYIFIYICMYTCGMYTYMYIHIYIGICVHVCAYTCVFMCMCRHGSMCGYAYSHSPALTAHACMLCLFSFRTHTVLLPQPLN